MNIITLIFNILFPPICVYCKRIGHNLCPSCKAKLDKCDFPLCIVCESLAIEGRTHKYCFGQEKYLPDLYLYTYTYNKISKMIINKAKGEKNAYRALDPVLEGINYMELKDYDYIVPIPPSRESNRLQDIVLYIARTLSIRLNIPVKMILLQTSSKSQKKLNRENRLQNALTKFSLQNKSLNYIFGKRILVIDDISTTDASLLNAGRILKANGAVKVGCYALFKDLRYNIIDA